MAKPPKRGRKLKGASEKDTIRKVVADMRNALNDHNLEDARDHLAKLERLLKI